jgi:tetratricopeptide (TPR) repeat protein
MKIPSLSTMCLSAAATLAAGVLAIASLPSSAYAAVTVIGAGPAQLCYDGAENGAGDALDYIFYCNQALKSYLTDHDRAATFINRGVLRLALNEPNTALEDFNAGLAIDASLSEGYIDRGASLIEIKKFAEAIDSINKGLALGAKRPELAYYDRAIADEAIGDVDAAYRDYQQALLAQPGFTMASDELKRFKVVHKTVGS